MNTVFKNIELQKQFNQDGFVVIPFIAKDLVTELNSVYTTHFPTAPEAFYSTSFIKDDDLKSSLNKQVEKLLGTNVQENFQNFKTLGSSFLSKPVGETGQMPVHQDWTIVDENKFASITIWIPLVDTNSKNGAIKVLKGSHNFNSAIRSPSIIPNITGVSEEILKRMETIEMKAGEAFIFNHAIFHASSINHSTKERVALTYGLVPQDAALCFYHNKGDNEISKYKVDNHFFQKYNSQIGEAPKDYEIMEEFKYEAPPFNKITLIEKLNNYTPMKAIFKDEATELFFQKNGFVKLKGIDEKAVQDLKSYYESLNFKDELGYGFHISMDQMDKSLVQESMKKIFDTVLPQVEHYFDNVKAHTCSFVVKEFHPQGLVPAHQDWTFVENEKEHCSISFWIPLIDVNMDNGALGVIKGSHHFSDYLRPSPSPEVKNPLGDAMFSLFPYFDIIEMKAGEVLAFNNKTFHASPPNTTKETRLAVGIGFTQADANLRHYYLKPNGKEDTVIEYEIDKEFFSKYDNGSISKLYNEGKELEGYKKLREIPYSFPSYNTDELIERIKANGNTINVTLVEKLAKLFNYNLDGSQKEEEDSNTEEIIETQEEAKLPFWKVYTPLNIVREIYNRVNPK